VSRFAGVGVEQYTSCFGGGGKSGEGEEEKGGGRGQAKEGRRFINL